MHILSLKERFLLEAENLIKEHLDIFSENDLFQFKKDLIAYLAVQRHMINKGFAFVIVVNKIVYGLILYEKDSYSHNAYTIKWLIVKKGEQNKGYGTHLMREVFKKVREVGGKHVYLETSAAKHNEHTKKFYEDLGFKQVGVLPDYFDPPIKFHRKLEDGIIYHKAL